MSPDLFRPLFKMDVDEVKKGIVDFSKNTVFQGLDILEAPLPGEKEAFVTFHAILMRDGQDVSFTEKSLFLYENEYLNEVFLLLKRKF